MASRPNILCFVTDQQRADHLGCCGNPDVDTPNIDRLAREGVTFSESYVANPVCMPNRASMFTGRYPKAHRLRENGNTLPPGEIVLPEVLRQDGYRTASFGKIHLAPFGLTKDKAEAEYELYESKQWWGEHDGLPLPYYGLEEVYFVGGHGHHTFGHYRKLLERRHPGTWEKLGRDHALVPPTGARESWKAAIPEEFHYDTIIAEWTIDYLKKHAGGLRPVRRNGQSSREAGKPFFVWCSFPDPHHPYCPPEPWCDRYDPKEIAFDPARRAETDAELDSLPPYVRECREGTFFGDLRKTTDDHYREIVAHTYGMISMVDHNIGRVLKCLEETGLLEDTVVVFFSDHGDLMGDHWLLNKGPFLFRGLVRVPTVWRLPESIRGGGETGRQTDALVSTIDLMPTLLDYAGVEVPSGVQGISYRGVLDGSAGEIRDRVYIELDSTNIDDRLRQMRSKDWALTCFAAARYGFLYDLRSDPRELHNLWDSAEHQEVKRDLAAELLRETSRADDWLPAKKCHA